MPQIYDMGPTLYLPSEGRRAEDFFALKIRRLRPGFNPRPWVPKASTLPLDHAYVYVYVYTRWKMHIFKLEVVLSWSV